MNALVYVDIDQGIYKVAQNEKKERNMWVFFFHKYGEFWSVLPEQKVEHEPLFSEDCLYCQNDTFAVVKEKVVSHLLVLEWTKI